MNKIQKKKKFSEKKPDDVNDISLGKVFVFTLLGFVLFALFSLFTYVFLFQKTTFIRLDGSNEEHISLPIKKTCDQTLISDIKRSLDILSNYKPIEHYNRQNDLHYILELCTTLEKHLNDFTKECPMETRYSYLNLINQYISKISENEWVGNLNPITLNSQKIKWNSKTSLI